MKQIPIRLKPADFESKWQKIWEERAVFSPNLQGAKKPYYNLMMFPYPSAEGLHVGNMYAFTGVDVHGRFMRMQGFDVFEPIGLDGFGIHSENYALKVNRHPKEQAKITQKNYYRQLRAIGNGFDWQHTLETYDPDYYKWTQWLFVEMFKHGLAYRAKAEVNWCPSCKTVLADEQVIDGKCERTGDVVIKKELEQWFFRITSYAERLLQNTYKTSFNWPNKVKIGQRNWIGKKEGINIKYQISPSTSSGQENSKYQIECFTTRPDTNFGATFIVISPQHPLAVKIATPEQKNEVSEYIKKSQSISKEDRQAAGRKKTGVFTGAYAINNLNGYKMPVWVSDFVLMDVGTGAVVGVPGHDKRDFEFAVAKNIPIKRVVIGSDADRSEIVNIDQVQEEMGTMINSEFLNGMDIHTATIKMMDYLEEKGWGKRIVSYHLRDWLISRQRYWGAPIPMIHCEKCGWFPVPEKDLPVLLPDVENWRPTGTGRGPLAGVPEFYKTSCPNCGGEARRETDVCDTFLDSSWYYLRYPSVGNQKSKIKNQNFPWDIDINKKWLPVHSYIGGAEHTVLHLLYARFVWMALRDWRYLPLGNEVETQKYNPDEPFQRFFAHGLIVKDGAKMSKSKGNVVVPDEYIKLYGADTLRTYLMFLGPFDAGGDFRDTGIAGMYRWLSRVWRLVTDHQSDNKTDNSGQKNYSDGKKSQIFHKIIKEVTQEMSHLRYNTAIAKLMECTNWWMTHPEEVSEDAVIDFLKLLAPFAPFMTEELYQKIRNQSNNFDSIHLQTWPEFDEGQLIAKNVTMAVQINGKMRDTLIISVSDANNEKIVEEKALGQQKIAKWMSGNMIVKTIFVAGKIINLVVKPA